MSVENLKQQRIHKLSEMLTENPGDLFLKYALAMEHAGLQNTAYAIQLLEEIVGSNPEYVAAYYQLGVLYHQAEQQDLAIKILQTGIEWAKKQKANTKTLNEFRSLLDELLF